MPSGGPPDNALISPTFLTFAPTAVQQGSRALWDLELIYLFKSFSFYGEYNAGNAHFASTTAPGTVVPVSVSGWSATATYFFTGELPAIQRRRIKPVHPYSWKNCTLGAFEGYARYSNLILSSNVLTAGLTNPALNANGVNAVDAGINWYLNQYIKIVCDWQHAMFNRSVALAPNRGIHTENLFWTRFQLYY